MRRRLALPRALPLSCDLQAESETDRVILQGLVRAATLESVIRLHRSARHLTDFTNKLEERQVERGVEEVVRALYRLRGSENGRVARKSGAAHVRRDVGRLVVLVHAATSREAEKQQA